MKYRKRVALGVAVAAFAAAPAAANASAVFGGGTLASPSGASNVFTFNNITPSGGTVTVVDIQTGNRYSGSVSCMDVNGNQASFTILVDPTTSQGSPAVVARTFWVADNGFNPTTPTDAQRNIPLTSKQLIRQGGPSACPDPTAPPGPLLPIASGDITVQP